MCYELYCIGMTDEISNVFSHMKSNKDNIENDMVEVEVEVNEDNIENEIVELNEMVETKGVENKAKDPKLGMIFDSIDDAMIYYRRMLKKKVLRWLKELLKRGMMGW